MKKITILLLAILLVTASCSTKKSGGLKLRTDADSVAYVIGMNIGLNLQRMDSTINVNAVCEGIRDYFQGATRLTLEQAETYYLSYVNYMLPEKARIYEEQFLADIAKSSRSYARTRSGVTYTVEEVGDQNQIPSSDRDSVVVRYLIRTADGQELYSSYEKGDTLRSALGDLRAGVQESLRLIGKGGKIDAWMPAATAYGSEGDSTLRIGPNATLYYEITLLEVDKSANRSQRNNLRR